MLSIIIPTFNEFENPLILSRAIHDVLGSRQFEIVFVDDSNEISSINTLLDLENTLSYVRVFHRENEKGLATAVVFGMEKVQGDMIAVMDCDLQHPPELLTEMMEYLDKDFDLVIPSRFVKGGDDGVFSFFRKMVSFVARWMAKGLLKRIRLISDPTSGFFLMKRKVIDGVQLQPIGWKILIEVLVRGRYDTVVEIPYTFQPRVAGTSNMSLKEQWNYIRHLVKLVGSSPEDRRLYLFAMVGFSGVLLNILIYALLVHAHMPVWLAGFTSGTLAMISNFLLNDRLTWMDSHQGQWINRFLKYVLTSLIGIVINTICLSILHYGFHMHYLFANIIGICVAMVWNFIVNNFWTWNMEKKKIEVTISLGNSENKNLETSKG